MGIERVERIVRGRRASMWIGPWRDRETALLLLHGGGGDAAVHWERVLPSLAAERFVVAPDFPGFGGSEALGAEASFAALRDWSVGVLDALAIERAVVVGNSFGAAIARYVAAAYPERVQRVVLVDGGAAPPIPRWLGRAFAWPVFDPLFAWMKSSAFSERGLAKMIVEPALLDGAMQSRMRASSDAFVGSMRNAALAGLPDERTPRTPVSIVWGARDALTPLRVGERLVAELPGSELHVIEGGGHMPQIERSAEMTRLLLSLSA